MNLILATIIITGSAPDSLGCPASALAQELQVWHARVVRTGQVSSLPNIMPGQPFAFNIPVASADTFAVAVWGENSAGYGCATILNTTATETVDVPWSPWVQRTATMPVFDLAGRKVRDPQPHRLYFIPGGIVVIDGSGRMWIRKQGALY